MLRACLLIGLLLVAARPGAVERSDDGYGQVLLYPYFSAGSELSTVVSVTRTVSAVDRPREEPLAISVVVRLDTGDASGTVASEAFTVLLAPHASWNFTLSPLHGRTALTTASSTCAFRGEAPLEESPAVFAVDGVEGWIEVYVLGLGKPGLGILDLQQQRRCAEIGERLAGLSAADWLVPAGNLLRGGAHLVSVSTGTSFSLPTVALKDFTDTSAWPFGEHPTLADVSPPVARVPTRSGDPLVATFVEHPVDAVSAVLMDAQWEVDFTSDPALGAQTDLVIVSPTREWYVGGETTRAPFASHQILSPNGAVRTEGRLQDRDGNLSTAAGSAEAPQAKCTPPPTRVPQPGPAMGTSVVVVHFAPQPALPSARTVVMGHRGLHPGTCFSEAVPVWQRITSGRLALRFDLRPDIGIGSLISDEGHVFTGLPVIGAALTKAVNGDVGGSLANFGLVQWISRTAGSPLLAGD